MTNPQKIHFLIVDDDKLIRSLICKMLEGLGCQATAVCDGFRAVGLLEKKNGFHCLLTDINMPSMNGWELARRVKAIDPCMPIVAITGESAKSVNDHLDGSGISRVVHKPFDVDELKNVVNFVRRESVECK